MPSTAGPTRLPIRARITLASALALAVLVAIALVSYRSVGVLVETSARVGHTHEVLGTLESLLGGVITAETGVRGYVLTGEERFLGTYWSGMQRAEIGLAALRRLTADNPEQQDRLISSRSSRSGCWRSRRSTRSAGSRARTSPPSGSG